jgi:hypothetical protein
VIVNTDIVESTHLQDTYEINYDMKCITVTIDSKPHLILGPVIGKLTSTSVNILMEYYMDNKYELKDNNNALKYVELLIVDVVSSVEYVCRKPLEYYTPILFEFNNLLPNHSYQISTYCNKYTTSNNIIYGIFTTHSNKQILIEEIQYNNKYNKLQQQYIQYQKARAKSIDDIKLDYNAVLKELINKTVNGFIYAALKSVALREMKLASQPENEVPKNLPVLAITPPSARIAIIGHMKPSMKGNIFRNPLTHVNQQTMTSLISNDGSSDINELCYDRLDLACLYDGEKIIENLNNSIKSSWNGIDLIIHIGCNIDLNNAIYDAISYITQAENITNPNNEYKNMLLKRAEQVIKDCYYFYWGHTMESIFSSLLSCGNHLMLSCSAYDLLYTLQYDSFQTLSADFTPVSYYILLHLYIIMSEYYYYYIYIYIFVYVYN